MVLFLQKFKNTPQMANYLCAVYGNGVIAEKTVQKWLSKLLFRGGKSRTPEQDLHHKGKSY